MSELLARTIARALPLLTRRWQDETRGEHHMEQLTSERESSWGLLADAVRSGEYRPLLAAIRHEHAHASDPEAVMTAKLSLLGESVRTVYEGDPRDLPTLLREMEAVQAILLHAVTEMPESAIPAPLIGALDRAAGVIPFVTTEYAPGEMIGVDTDREPLFAIVRHGRVRLMGPLPDSRMVLLAILREGDFFAIPDARTRLQASAEAMTHSSISLLDARDIPTLIRIAPEAATLIVASLSAQLTTAHRMIGHILGHETSIRLIALLLALAAAFGEPENGKMLITYPATHQDLAEMIGANRVTVSRKLTDLQKAGLIIPERRNMMIVDVAALAALLDE